MRAHVLILGCILSLVANSCSRQTEEHAESMASKWQARERFVQKSLSDFARQQNAEVDWVRALPGVKDARLANIDLDPESRPRIYQIDMYGAMTRPRVVGFTANVLDVTTNAEGIRLVVAYPDLFDVAVICQLRATRQEIADVLESRPNVDATVLVAARILDIRRPAIAYGCEEIDIDTERWALGEIVNAAPFTATGDLIAVKVLPEDE